VNVAHAPAGIPSRVTSLVANGGGTASVEAVLEALLHTFVQRLEDWHMESFTTTRAAWLARAHRMGSTIGVTTGDHRHQNVRRLGNRCALVVQTADGFVAGDVTV
jgi:BirA family transcriptional regulator, biotin operon repressor / biotin---[acetyl-CoA-carboxylase] ligase